MRKVVNSTKKQLSWTRFLSFVPIVNGLYLMYICIKMQCLKLFTPKVMLKLIMRIFPIALTVGIASGVLTNAHLDTVVDIVEMLWMYVGISYTSYYFARLVNSNNS